MGRRLGLLGGTFDPVHTGHLLMAEVARHALSLDQVVFVPAGVPPHKCEAVTPAEHRYAMVLLATAPNESFAVSRRELERSGPSYSLTTIREYRREIGPTGELFFIAGADTVLLGCTHYPLLASVIGEVMGPGPALVDSAHATAEAVAQLLAGRGMARRDGVAHHRTLCTDVPDRFHRMAERFLGRPVDSVELIDLVER